MPQPAVSTRMIALAAAGVENLLLDLLDLGFEGSVVADSTKPAPNACSPYSSYSRLVIAVR
jgi:hypothetical protein